MGADRHAILENVHRSAKPAPSADARLKRLADQIEALAEKDALVLRRAAEIGVTRRAAAAELHATCSDFVEALNRLLTRGEVVVDPPDLAEDYFSEDAPNLVQINVRGRILQVEFAATPELVSTEEFRVPYTLAGTVRAFNQELLDKDLIEEQLIFYILEKNRAMWLFFDPRTYRSGPFDRNYLISLMEQLL
jgi:hypothetical protein